MSANRESQEIQKTLSKINVLVDKFKPYKWYLMNDSQLQLMLDIKNSLDSIYWNIIYYSLSEDEKSLLTTIIEKIEKLILQEKLESKKRNYVELIECMKELKDGELNSNYYLISPDIH
jgi:predicted solute-binding protein